MDEKLKRIKGKKNGNSCGNTVNPPCSKHFFLENNENVFNKRRNKHSDRLSIKIPGRKPETNRLKNIMNTI